MNSIPALSVAVGVLAIAIVLLAVMVVACAVYAKHVRMCLTATTERTESAHEKVAGLEGMTETLGLNAARGLHLHTRAMKALVEKVAVLEDFIEEQDREIARLTPVEPDEHEAAEGDTYLVLVMKDGTVVAQEEVVMDDPRDEHATPEKNFDPIAVAAGMLHGNKD